MNDDPYTNNYAQEAHDLGVPIVGRRSMQAKMAYMPQSYPLSFMDNQAVT